MAGLFPSRRRLAPQCEIGASALEVGPGSEIKKMSVFFFALCCWAGGGNFSLLPRATISKKDRSSIGVWDFSCGERLESTVVAVCRAMLEGTRRLQAWLSSASEAARAAA